MRFKSSSLRPLVFFVTVLLYLFIVGCNDDDDASPAVLAGPMTSIGDGEAWAEVVFGADGEPTEIAAVFTQAALDSLPRQGHIPAHEFVLQLPTGADIPPYDHVTLDWNAHGHEPPGVYDLPHFDVHFYWLSAAERDAITPTDSVAFNRPLPAAKLAPMYLETPGGVPRMGAHVIDLMSPEIAGTGTFTHTFIYGKYDAELVFLEPMVSEDFLRSRQDVSRAVRWPEDFGRPGYFPQEYRVEYDEASATYRIALSGLLRRE